MNTNTLIAFIVLSLFTSILIGVTIVNQKTPHDRRMELIEEKERLVRLLNEQQLNKNIFETKRLIREVDSLYKHQ